jgi:hypothetical protein
LTRPLSGFKQHPRDPYWYEQEIAKPVFKTAVVRYMLYPDGQVFVEPIATPSTTVSASLYCNDHKGISGDSERAWTDILARPEVYEKELTRKLWAISKANFTHFLAAHKKHHPPDRWNEIKHIVDFSTQEALETQCSLCGITILQPGLDHKSTVAFDFRVGWDPEHGISVLMHDGRVLAASGRGDFCGRADGGVGHAKELQAHHFHPGDRKL